MESAPDLAMPNSPNINSVLKPPKPRVPLKDLITAAPEEDNTAARKRRVSFANVNKIKEFSAGAESMVVLQTPAYEEPFSVSSDSSYPSGMDGWTPGKQQPSAADKLPQYPEKENLTIQSMRMSTGMDMTGVVGNADWNTRYSVNGMDLTEVANTQINQQTRFSLGMDLTCVGGVSSQNTRYSVGGMDLTNVTHSDQAFLDQKTRFSMGMDLTSVVGHSTQRYSVNGMDFTEAINQHQSFHGSARYSVGMDMTKAVGDSVPTIRYSCNEMDFTEAVNPRFYKEQSCTGGSTANVSTDESDTLELTEVVQGAQFSAPSPKYKTSKVGLSENILYSVSNTRYSVNAMDLTSGIGAQFSICGRRKSTRYSIVNMDLTEALNNSSGNLEFTQAIGDPRMRTTSTRNSLCEMDLTESITDKAVTEISPEVMDQTSVVADQLEYSADTESIVNTSKNISNDKVCDKENILPNQSLKFSSAPKVLPSENPMCTAEYELLSEMPNDQVNLCEKENILPNQSLQLNSAPIGLSRDNEMYMPTGAHESLNKIFIGQVGQCNKENVLPNQVLKLDDAPMVSSHETSLCTLQEPLSEINTAVNKNHLTNILPECQTEQKELYANMSNNKCVSFLSEKKEGIVDRKDASLAINETLSNSQKEICHSGKKINEISEPKIMQQEQITDALDKHNLNQSNFVKESKVSITDPCVNAFERDLSRKGDSVENQYNSCLAEKENISEQILDDDAMDVSITLDTGMETQKPNICEEPHSSEIENTKRHTYGIKYTEINMESTEKITRLNESVMNMSIDTSSVIQEVEDGERIDEQMQNNPEQPDPDYKGGYNNNIANESLLIQEQNHQPVVGSVTSKEESIQLNISPNTSFNMTSSLLCSKNITMTRGRSMIFALTPDTSMDTNQKDSRITESRTTQNTSVALKIHNNNNALDQSENDTKKDISSLEITSGNEKRGKRSFEEALEPENDIEESPVKQLCLSKEEPSTEYEMLNNVTAPSYLMETMAHTNETLPCLDQHEAVGISDQLASEPTSHTEIDSSFTKDSVSSALSKREISLQIDDSVTRNAPNNALQHDFIDLCESSFDATSTEVRDLINSSCYKSRIEEVVTNKIERLSCISKIESPPPPNLCFGNIESEQKLKCSLKELNGNISLETDKAIGTEILTREADCVFVKSLSTLHKSTLRRKIEKVRHLGNNTYIAEFIPNFIEIHFSINSFDRVHSETYHNISSAKNTAIGEYLLRLARNTVLTDKGSDLISQLQSTNRSFLTCLARNLNLICKYFNGSIKGHTLTLEIASCRKHFWTLIDINLKSPQHLSSMDITISEQKIGEMKLSLVRKMFNSIERSQDQLLHFAKAINMMKYNN